MKYLISISIGILVGLLAMVISEYSVLALFPLANQSDILDITSLSENMESMPLQNLILILIGYAIAAILAGFIGTKLKTENLFMTMIAIGVSLTIIGCFYLLMIPYPLWMIIAGSVIFIPMTWLGSKIYKARHDDKLIYKF